MRNCFPFCLPVLSAIQKIVQSPLRGTNKHCNIDLPVVMHINNLGIRKTYFVKEKNVPYFIFIA